MTDETETPVTDHEPYLKVLEYLAALGIGLDPDGAGSFALVDRIHPRKREHLLAALRHALDTPAERQRLAEAGVFACGLDDARLDRVRRRVRQSGAPLHVIKAELAWLDRAAGKKDD